MVWGVAGYEFRMAVRRPGAWLAFALGGLTAFNAPSMARALSGTIGVWAVAGQVAFMLNLWMPLLAGIVLADRLPRDRRLATLELLGATATPRATIVLGKYLGGLLSVALPVLAATLAIAAASVVLGTPPALLGVSALAFAVVNLPPLAFVAAFSIACPAVLPVRVYQVLFTGYWFWGNFLNPKALPTISDTVLVASGLPQATAFFNAPFGRPATSTYAVLNLLTLAACAATALASVVAYQRRQDRLA